MDLRSEPAGGGAGGPDEEPTQIIGKYVRLNASVSRIAARQDLVIGLEQLVDLGFGVSAVHKRAATHRWHRVHCRVYSLVPPHLLSRRGRLIAAVLACGDGAAVSHGSAAQLLGLRPSWAGTPADIHVTAPRRHKLDGVTTHCSTTLTAKDITHVDGIPCTTVARTLLDLGDHDDPGELEDALDRAQASRRLRAKAITDQLARNANRVAAKRLRAAVATRRPGQKPVDSPLEQRFVAALRDAGVPPPERQVVMELGDGGPTIRVDFMWREQRLVLETDGREAHGTGEAFEEDRRRDQRLVAAGWRPIRVTWRQVGQDPVAVATLVGGLVAGHEGEDATAA